MPQTRVRRAGKPVRHNADTVYVDFTNRNGLRIRSWYKFDRPRGRWDADTIEVYSYTHWLDITDLQALTQRQLDDGTRLVNSVSMTPDQYRNSIT